MASIPGYALFNGATITRVVDGAGAEWIGMCAKHNGGDLCFYAFKNGVNVPLSPVCHARGTIASDGTWIAWNGSQYYTGALPGFTPIPASGGGGGWEGTPIAIPPGSPLSAIWTPAYTAAEVDSPEEIAVKLTKNNDQWEQLIGLLKQAGVLV